MEEENKKEEFKISYVILSIFLICIGITALIYFVPALIHSWPMTIINLLLSIPLMLVIIVLPLWAGFGLLIQQLKLLIKRKG